MQCQRSQTPEAEFRGHSTFSDDDSDLTPRTPRMFFIIPSVQRRRYRLEGNCYGGKGEKNHREDVDERGNQMAPRRTFRNAPRQSGYVPKARRFIGPIQQKRQPVKIQRSLQAF